MEEKIAHLQSITWKETSFVFHIIPKATPRPRASFVGGSHIFYVKGANDHKVYLKYYLKNEDIEIISTPIKFYCKVFLPTPKSMNKIEQVYAELGWVRPISKPDWDNLAKTYCDMISGTIITDDRLIIEGSLEKYYSIKPRIEITLKYMDQHDSQFNWKKMVRKEGL